MTMKYLRTTPIMLLLAGCVTTSPQTKQEIWDYGRIAVSLESGCRSGPIRALAKGCWKGKRPTPAVIFLHGCSGLNYRQFAHMEMFSDLGFPVFAPNSYSRPGRHNSCGAYNSVASWRSEEVKIALENVGKLGWVDMNRLVLAGFSEGGIAAAEYSGGEFKAVVAMGFGCNNRGFAAPANVPALQINGKDDKEINDISLCTAGSRKSFKAMYVDTGHPVDGNPRTKAAIKELLRAL